MITSGNMVKDEQHFEHPEEFMPDQWDKSQSAALNPYSSMPFGFGPRACYGVVYCNGLSKVEPEQFGTWFFPTEFAEDT